MNYLAHIVTEQSVTLVTDEETIMVPRSHISYDDVVELLDREEYMEAITVADATRRIEEFGEGKVTVIGGVVFYNGQELHNALTRRILAMVKDGFNIEPMVQFLTNLMSNPSARAIQELYRFLEANSLPITPDGYFLAYKQVNSDYRDSYTDTFDNNIGKVCKMPRNEVMDDPTITCSTGLHFCSLNYLNGNNYHGTRIMVLKIHPADVVSIPVDYENSKGRCCKYEVVAEHMDGAKDTLSNTSVNTNYPSNIKNEWIV